MTTTTVNCAPVTRQGRQTPHPVVKSLILRAGFRRRWWSKVEKLALLDCCIMKDCGNSPEDGESTVARRVVVFIWVRLFSSIHASTLIQNCHRLIVITSVILYILYLLYLFYLFVFVFTFFLFPTSWLLVPLLLIGILWFAFLHVSVPSEHRAEGPQGPLNKETES